MTLVGVWSEGYLAHDARWLLWAGARLDGDEEADRALILRDHLDRAGVAMVEAETHERSHIERVHAPGMIDYLESAYEEWVAAGYPEDPGSDRVVAYAFRHPAAFGRYRTHEPASRAALAGVYCIDTATTIGPGTYRGARAAIDGALSAAALVRSGARAAYAPVRPPGHHAGSSYFGGSCYLNNVAVATAWLAAEGVSRVAIVDIDAHHGNGTQEIFYERGDVLYTSVHVDPGRGWYPHWCGFPDETGSGPGRGANRNFPLPPGSGDEQMLATIDRMCETVVDFSAEVLVVSCGVDSGATDPESPLRVTGQGFNGIGRRLHELGLPTVLIQEGGYDLAALRPDTMAILASFL